MEKNTRLLATVLLVLAINYSFAQNKAEKATSFGKITNVRIVPSIAEQLRTGKFIYADPENIMEAPPKRRLGNKAVPGKGSDVIDAALQTNYATRQGRAPSLVFDADTTPQAGVTDPTGAVGPNHYLAAWNFGFRIFDKSGNPLTPEANLGTILDGNNAGDPIMLYDPWADRFIITEFDGNPNGFEMAISMGPDPVNDGWFVYTNIFETDEFPDYTKFSIWSDGYYVTANKNVNNEGIYVVEREKLLIGEPAQFVALPLPNLSRLTFISPQGFNATNGELPPPGNFTVVYLQDDSFAGVPQGNDHLKLWTVNVDWEDPANSTISQPVELGSSEGVSAFTSVFDGGSFSNLDQPGENSPDIDALQATIMNQAQYRRFCDYNSAVFNFVVDTAPGAEELAGIRWYELRQDVDGGPWTVFQEGTYTAPDGRHAFSGSMAMDVFGNIGMGYTSVGSNDGEEISIRYTGRLFEDPLGDMTISEQLIAQSTVNNPGNRLADYVHLTVDPADGQTFWHIAEYFIPQRSDVVGVFKIAESDPIDAAAVNVVSPVSSTLTANQPIIIEIINYGSSPLSDVPVSYSINGLDFVNETFTGSIPAPINGIPQRATFTFDQLTDLSGPGDYTIDIRTEANNDAKPHNDCYATNITNIAANDIGVIDITAPEDGLLNATESVTVSIKNFGTSPQSDITVSFSVDGDAVVNDIFPGPLDSGSSATFTFTAGTADLSILNQTYAITASTNLVGDEDNTNDSFSKNVTNAIIICEPTGNCTSDLLGVFQLADIDDSHICNEGYNDSTDISTSLDRSAGNNAYDVTVQSGFAPEVLSLWIDFNDNGDFTDAGEQLLTSETITSENVDATFTITIPTDANLGAHRMRVRNADIVNGTGDVNDPCGDVEWGNTTDYSVTIEDTLSTTEFDLNSSAFTIITLPNNQFKITLKTSFNALLEFNVYDITGQQIVFNNIEKSGAQSYTYDLDMSYASSGIYIIKMGSRNKYQIGKIIVK
jgi:hypothetical protein